MYKPDKNTYYMNIAETVAQRADCVGSLVGAVVVVDDRIVATGYNGTPSGVTNCLDDGCPRCSARARGEIQSGELHDRCICVHAEENALLTAAREGVRMKGCTMYTTVQPCLACLMRLIQAGAKVVYYARDYAFDELALKAYRTLQAESGTAVQKLPRPTPTADAISVELAASVEIPHANGDGPSAN